MKRSLFLLAVPAVLLAGCSAGETTPTAQPATTAPTAAQTAEPTAAPTKAAAPTDAAPTKAASPTKADSPTKAATTGRCHSQDLSVKTAGGDGAAGSYSVNLVFTNKSGQKCTLYGYPGVSWVTGNNGVQVNDPFSRTDGTKKTITLKPGDVAHSVLIQGQTGNFSTADCKPVKARGYRVYPPEETASIFVDVPQTVCSAKGVGVGRVNVITTGPGESA